MVNFTISIWAKRCIDTKENFKDRKHELVLYKCLSRLIELKKDPSQILLDRELLVKAISMEKYEVGTLENWLKLISVSEENNFLQPLQ